MALPTIYWFSKIIEYVARVVPVVASVLAFFAWAYNIAEMLVIGSLNAIINQIASLDISQLGSADFSAWIWIGYVNALFPLGESIALLGAYYTAWMVVILVRWVKSFIPTMSN
jgi:hypothetical protein